MVKLSNKYRFFQNLFSNNFLIKYLHIPIHCSYSPLYCNQVFLLKSQWVLDKISYINNLPNSLLKKILYKFVLFLFCLVF